ncbi:MAG TPA: ribonuclease R, partial [Erythrobacter sp.]|nr:ribonuclease R [Erythrobacter sp.]
EKLGGDGLVPVSTLGREYFSYDEGARKLVGERSGTEYAVGDRLKLKLAEANALTGALKFEVPDSDGTGVEPRGNRAPEKKRTHQNKRPKKAQGAPRQSHPAGKRGRPGNIRHQGRKKK